MDRDTERAIVVASDALCEIARKMAEGVEVEQQILVTLNRIADNITPKLEPSQLAVKFAPNQEKEKQ